MKPFLTWIVVADGAHAKIFLNQGVGKGLVPQPIHEIKVELPPTRDLGTDRPGRVHDRAGTRHAMTPPVDWHEAEKERFAKQVAALLDNAAAEKLVHRLVLVAPAKILGYFRRSLGKAAAGLVDGELSKDLTKVDVRSLPEHLAGTITL